MKKLYAAAAALLSVSCGALAGGTIGGSKPGQVPVYTFGIVACGVPAAPSDPCPKPIAGAVVAVNSTAGYVTKTADRDGYALFTSIIPFSDVKITADGFLPFAVGIQPPVIDKQNLSYALTPEKPPHVDPSVFPLEQLAAIRGAMWPLGTASTCGALPFGPRPGAADNVIATDFITDYSPEQQACIVAELKARGYTHVVMGPLVDSDGYHGAWPPNDWRGANFERFLDAAQMFWDAGLAPVVFIHPDGWTFEQTRDTFTPLLQSSRAQQLLRLVVPFGWEPCKYECSSWTWAAFGQWARQTLPNALVLLHTVCDVDAPVGTDSRGDDNGTGNATGWARVVPFYHGWLTQSCAFEHPDAHGDPNHPDKTNFDNWADLFNPNVRGSYRDRFEHGYAGWPRDSAWGIGKPLLVYAGEYSAYWRFWQHRTEAEGVAWGNRAIASGAAGYLDSGSVAVK